MTEGDVLLIQTNDGGEITITNGAVEMTSGFETAIFLSLFGGNSDDDVTSSTDKGWWGNIGEREVNQYRSRTQNKIESLPLTSGNLLEIEEAVQKDLEWFITESIANSIEISVTIPALNTVQISGTISAIGNEFDFNYTVNWKKSKEDARPSPTFSTPRTSNPFLSTWETTTNNEVITLPLLSGGNYDFWVKWGDGSSSHITSSSASHTYKNPQKYQMEIVGTIEGWAFNNSGDKDKILSIDQWGDLKISSIGYTTGNYFYGCSNLTFNATDAPDLSTATTLARAFRDCVLFDVDVSGWDTSTIVDFGGPFSGCSAFNSSVDGFVTSAATEINSIFENCTSFNQPITGWNTSNVFNFNNSFRGMTSFSQDVTGLDVSSGQTFNNMFRDTSIDQDFGSWDVTSMTGAPNMFTGVTLSTANYDALLTGWEGQPVLNNVTFGAGNSKYTSGGAAEAARNALDPGKSWTITDGGPV